MSMEEEGDARSMIVNLCLVAAAMAGLMVITLGKDSAFKQMTGNMVYSMESLGNIPVNSGPGVAVIMLLFIGSVVLMHLMFNKRQ